MLYPRENQSPLHIDTSSEVAGLASLRGALSPIQDVLCDVPEEDKDLPTVSIVTPEPNPAS